MRIFVTGTEGYLGSLLTADLLRLGYEVTGLDTGFYIKSECYRDGGPTPLTLAKDLRMIELDDLKGCKAIVHMAELSNDPAGRLVHDLLDIAVRSGLPFDQISGGRCASEGCFLTAAS